MNLLSWFPDGKLSVPRGVCEIPQLHLHADIGRLLLTVTSVGSTREAIHVLSCEGASIDIVLAEADLPMANCMKILKYITQDQELRCIPVISMFVLVFFLLFSLSR